MENISTIGVVLAGGNSSRMQGVDKSEIMFEGQSLVARAVARLSPQVSEVCLSSAHDYGLDCVNISDITEGQQGPLAGVFAALTWVVQNRPHAKAIVTVPVDAPFSPDDIAQRLVPIVIATQKPAIAQTADGLQPTFACWPVAILPDLAAHMKKGEAGALHYFAKKMGAANIMFDDPHQFYNINNKEDLAKLS